MNIDEFFNECEALSLQISTKPIFERAHLLDNEALFQIPLISMVILIMSKDRRKPNISEIGQLVGESIESSMYGFKGSAQHIGWSSNLRVRTVKAMSFLSRSNLIIIDDRKGKIEATELGKRVIERALDRTDDLAWNLSEIKRSYRNICISRQLEFKLI